MTGFLLDTHTLIWLFGNSGKLSKKAKAALDNDAAKLYVSIVSLWEIAIKISKEKAGFDGNTGFFFELLRDNGIDIIGVLPEHLGIVETLPFIHKDPFDRLIIATAKAGGMAIITVDENIRKYEIEWVW